MKRSVTIRITLLSFFLFGIVFASAAQASLSRLSWLIGTWETVTPKRTLYERWTKRNDTEFFATSYFIRGVRDTVVLESIWLTQNAEGLVYLPTVKGENQDLAVTFKLKSFTDNRVEFENPQHDFPQVITYTRLTPDSIEAETSGTVGGKTKSIKFPMKRIK